MSRPHAASTGNCGAERSPSNWRLRPVHDWSRLRCGLPVRPRMRLLRTALRDHHDFVEAGRAELRNPVAPPIWPASHGKRMPGLRARAARSAPTHAPAAQHRRIRKASKPRASRLSTTRANMMHPQYPAIMLGSKFHRNRQISRRVQKTGGLRHGSACACLAPGKRSGSSKTLVRDTTPRRRATAAPSKRGSASPHRQW